MQKVSEILNEVHRLIEKEKRKFILTGSSPRNLRRKVHNLLAGTALSYSMHALTVKELGQKFQLDHSLKFGQLPCVYTESNPKKYLKSYVKTYFDEEVKQEGLTRNLASFSRFMEAASFSQGSVLSITEVARECSIERKVVENYFHILEDLLIGYRIPVFTKKAKRRMVAHPKIYFFDVGVFRTLRPMGPLDMPEESEGAAFETLLFQEINVLNSMLETQYKIYYWRTASEKEVDIFLYGPKGLLAIEVKRTSRITNSMLSSLKSFEKYYPIEK